MKRVVKTLKVHEVEWARWQAVAGNTPVSTWLRELANEESGRLEAEGRRVGAARLERERLRQALGGNWRG